MQYASLTYHSSLRGWTPLYILTHVLVYMHTCLNVIKSVVHSLTFFIVWNGTLSVIIILPIILSAEANLSLTSIIRAHPDWTFYLKSFA